MPSLDFNIETTATTRTAPRRRTNFIHTGADEEKQVAADDEDVPSGVSVLTSRSCLLLLACCACCVCVAVLVAGAVILSRDLHVTPAPTPPPTPQPTPTPGPLVKRTLEAAVHVARGIPQQLVRAAADQRRLIQNGQK